MIYAIVYIIILVCILGHSSIHKTRLPLIAVTIVLIGLVAFRGLDVDQDLREYYNNWTYLRQGIILPYEPFSILIFKLSPYFLMVTLIYSVLGVGIKVFAFTKLSPLPLLSILIYYSHFYFLHEMTQMRAGVASGLLLLQLYYIYNKQIKKSVVFLLLAILFHYSAIMGIIFYWINYHNKKFIKFTLLIFLGFIINLSSGISVKFLSIMHWSFIGQRIDTYMAVMQNGMQNSINVFNIAFILQLLLGYLFVFMSKNLNVKPLFVMLTKLYLLGIALYLIFSFIPVFAFRLSELLFVTECILIPHLIYLFKPKYLSKIIVMGLSLSLFILYVYHLNLVNSYKTILYI